VAEFRLSELDRWAEKTKQTADQVVRSTLLQITEMVIMRTPVDTGRARGNWLPSLGSPASGEGSPDPGGTQTIQSALPVIRDATGDIYYLTNNLPYIRRLEYEGWSGQAPAGMLRVSVQEFERALRQAVAES
jgi:hypothetical protein